MTQDNAQTGPESPQPSEWFVIRLSSLGDAALTTGVLAFWQRRYGWAFTVVTKKAFAPLFAGHPAVTRVIGLDDADLPLPRLLPLFRGLAAGADGSGLIDLHGTLRSRLLAALWRGPVRRYGKLTLERRAFLASGGRLFRQRLNARNVPQRYAGAVENAAPPRQELLPCIVLSPEEVEQGRARVAGLRGQAETRRPSAPLIALHPYAAHPDKAWAPAAWQNLIAGLDADGAAWFVIGRAGDRERLPGVPAERDFTNRTSLRETCALLRAADALVTGDSGPMHLATGVSTPVVALFGPTTPEWGFAPAGPRDQLVQPETDEAPCRPCSLHGGTACRRGRVCMAAITPARVREALRRCLQGRPDSRPPRVAPATPESSGE